MKTKVNNSTGYKKSTNLQAKWPMISMVSEEVRTSIIRRLELQQVQNCARILEGPDRAGAPGEDSRVASDPKP